MNGDFFDLTGHTALITGSSRGIGRAIGVRLSKAGAQVIFHGARSSEKLTSALAEAGNSAVALTADLTLAEEIETLISKLNSYSVDILVLNASVQSYTGIENFSVAEFQRQMQVNVSSCFKLIQAIAPRMCRKNWGRIVMVGSINQQKPAARLAIYSATKAALANLARLSAKLYAENGITVNTIMPGVIETDRNQEALKNKDFSAALLKDIPMHRFGNSAECAALVHYLVSPEAGYVTGSEIAISGGWQL